MPDAAAIDAELVQRARAAFRAGDLPAAKRHAAELWARYEDRARVASRRLARGAEADDVLGCIGVRFVQWVYHRNEDPRNMVGLINQMAKYAYGDVQRTEARQAPTIEEIEDTRYDEEALDLILDRDLLDRLFPVLNDRERLIIDRTLEGVADADIAAELDVDPNNLHQIRWRAHKRLRAEAERQELAL
ncbi:MAG: RNA polymerase sigma factor [Gaiellales bacterium]